MLVDNAVVVSDAIQVLYDEGEERLDACAKGVKSVAFPVLASTMTTVYLLNYGFDHKLRTSVVAIGRLVC